MSDFAVGERMVLMTAEQAAAVNECIESLMRANQNERAAKLMNLALAYKFGHDLDPPLPENVVEMHGFSRKVV